MSSARAFANNSVSERLNPSVPSRPTAVVMAEIERPFAAGAAEMLVMIDDAGSGDEPLRVDRLETGDFHVEPSFHGGDCAAKDQQIGQAHVLGRVQVDILQKQRIMHLFFSSIRNKRSIKLHEKKSQAGAVCDFLSQNAIICFPQSCCGRSRCCRTRRATPAPHPRST